MTRAAVLVGSGRYQDRWHDYAATGHEIANIISDIGVETVVRSLKPKSILDAVDADVLIINAGRGEYSATADGPDDDWPAAFDALREYRASKRPILALHSSSMSLHGLHEWSDWIGGRWVDGRSMHPPISKTTVPVVAPDHPITKGMPDITLFDELYSYQETQNHAEVLISHSYEGATHPLVWATDVDGARCVYDAFGHGVESYQSDGRRTLIQREVQWLTAV